MSKLIMSKGKVTVTKPLESGKDYNTNSDIHLARVKPKFGKAKGGAVSGPPRKVRTGKAT